MITSINFLFKNSNRVTQLYLYCRLRAYSHNRGGYFKGFEFTNNEKYKTLPRLIKLGWVTDSRVVNHRKIANRYTDVKTVCEVDDSHLKSLSSFKGHLVALAEANQLRWSYRLQNNIAKEYSRRDNTFSRKQVRANSKLDHRVTRKYIVKKFNDGYKGRVSNCIIQGILGISKSTVALWRKGSTNHYDQFSFRTPYKPEGCKSYFSKKRRCWINKDRVISTGINVFTTVFFTCYSGSSLPYTS